MTVLCDVSTGDSTKQGVCGCMQAVCMCVSSYMYVAGAGRDTAHWVLGMTLHTGCCVCACMQAVSSYM